MITTVTTVTTVTAMAAMGLTAAISIAATVILIFFLTVKELASNSNASFPVRLTRFLNVSVLPLIMVFAVIVTITIVEILT